MAKKTTKVHPMFKPPPVARRKRPTVGEKREAKLRAAAEDAFAAQAVRVNRLEDQLQRTERFDVRKLKARKAFLCVEAKMLQDQAARLIQEAEDIDRLLKE